MSTFPSESKVRINRKSHSNFALRSALFIEKKYRVRGKKIGMGFTIYTDFKNNLFDSEGKIDIHYSF